MLKRKISHVVWWVMFIGVLVLLSSTFIWIPMITGPRESGYINVLDIKRPKTRRFSIYVYDIHPSYRFHGLLTRANDQTSKVADINTRDTDTKYHLSVLMDLMFRSCIERVTDPREADLFFVPYEYSLAWDKRPHVRNAINDIEKILELASRDSMTEKDRIWVEEKWSKYFGVSSEYILRNGARDHVIPISHPHFSAFSPGKLLWNPIFITVEWALTHSKDNNRKNILVPYPITYNKWTNTESLSKDSERVIGFYRNNSRNTNPGSLESMFLDSSRPILFYSSMQIKDHLFLRSKLITEMKSAPGSCRVEIETLKPGDIEYHDLDMVHDYMKSSVFCPIITADTPSSRSLYNAIGVGCIPVIISDELALPFSDMIDYSEFVIRVSETDYHTSTIFSIVSHRMRNRDTNEMRNSMKLARKSLFYTDAELNLRDLYEDSNKDPVMIKKYQDVDSTVENAFSMIMEKLESIHLKNKRHKKY